MRAGRLIGTVAWAAAVWAAGVCPGADNAATASIARDANTASKRAEAAGFPIRPTISEPRSGLSENAETLDNVLRPLDIGERAKDQADAAASFGKSKFSRWLLPALGVVVVVGLAMVARRLPLPLPPMPR